MTARGQLRVYLGAAPGVGKTYEMLEEGHRRARPRHRRGRRLRRDATAGRTPRRWSPTWRRCRAARVNYRGTAFTEMDLDAVLARRPEVALVDELAHTNVPGSRNAKRWQDIQELLDAGITVRDHGQHPAPGVAQRRRRPDHRRAPAGDGARRGGPRGRADRAGRHDPGGAAPADGARQHLRRPTRSTPRSATTSGSATSPPCANWPCSGWPTRSTSNSTATGPSTTSPTPGRPGSGSSWHSPAAPRARPSSAGPPASPPAPRAPTCSPCTWPAATAWPAPIPPIWPASGPWSKASAAPTTRSSGCDVPTALLDFARGVNATQLVLGASRRGRFAQLFSPGVGVTTTAESGPIDVHLVTHEQVNRGSRALTLTRGLPAPRRISGFVAAGLGLPLLTLAADPAAHRADPAQRHPPLPRRGRRGRPARRPLPGPGRRGRGIPAAELVLHAAALPVDHRRRGEHPRPGGLPARRRRGQHRGRRWPPGAPAKPPAPAPRRRRCPPSRGACCAVAAPCPRCWTSSGKPSNSPASPCWNVCPTPPSPPTVQHDPAAWRVAAAVGDQPCLTPGQGDADVLVEDDISLVLRGHALAAEDRRVVEAFAAQAAVALRQERLEERAAAVGQLSEIDRLRTALLSAVSHDLRTPLASANAAVDSLRSTGHRVQ